MKRRRIMEWLRFFLPFILGVLLLVTGLDKIIYLEQFIASVKTRVYLPQAVAWAGILLVPGIEVISGLAYLNRLFLRETAYIVGFLLATFLLVSLTDMAFPSAGKGCGCMHFLAENPSPWLPIYHIALLLILGAFNLQILTSTKNKL